jgi:hypothetical protein
MVRPIFSNFGAGLSGGESGDGVSGSGAGAEAVGGSGLRGYRSSFGGSEQVSLPLI